MFSIMAQKHSNITSGLTSCLRFLFCDIRKKGFLSFLLFSFQFAWNSVFQNVKLWSTTQKIDSNSEAVNQSCTESTKQRGARLSKEEAIMVMESLGLSVGHDGDGIEEGYGEEEIDQMLDEETTLEVVEEAFRVFDENKDGFIDATELQRVLCCLGLEKGLMECQRMINAVDQNGDGVIDFDEFVEFMKQSFG